MLSICIKFKFQDLRRSSVILLCMQYMSSTLCSSCVDLKKRRRLQLSLSKQVCSS